MPQRLKQRKKKMVGRYRNAWSAHTEMGGRTIPKRLVGSYRNGWSDEPEIRTDELFPIYRFF